jgi:thiosulfate/3-mercaptopyruvate sulfurtransferase
VVHALALIAVTGVSPIISTEWLSAHLNDPNVRIVDVSEHEQYDRAHIPGAVPMDHMLTVGDQHRMLPPDRLAAVWEKLGVSDDTHVVLYGTSPMATGWVYMSLAVIGHGDQVSMLDGGIKLWQVEKRATATTRANPTPGRLSVRPAPDIVVDAAFVRSNLQTNDVRLLDVRTTQEFNNGHLPGATLILWQDLFADRDLLKFKSVDEIRALLTDAGVHPGQQVVTYCAVGMRASLMYWAARAAGVPARVYLGSYSDWIRDSSNPTIR